MKQTQTLMNMCCLNK